MSMNVNGKGESNPRTNICLPLTFEWYGAKALPALHSSKTIRRIELNVFDQAINKHSPFEQHLSHTKLHLCWCHKGP